MAENQNFNRNIPHGIYNGIFNRREDYYRNFNANLGRNFPGYAGRGGAANNPQPPHVNDLGWNFFANLPRPNLPPFQGQGFPQQQPARDGQPIDGNVPDDPEELGANGGDNVNDELFENNGDNVRAPPRGNGAAAGPPYNFVEQGHLTWEQLARIYPYRHVYADLLYYRDLMLTQQQSYDRVDRKLKAEKKTTKRLETNMKTLKTEIRVLRSMGRR